MLTIAETIDGYPIEAAETVTRRLVGDPSPVTYIPSTATIERPGRPPGVYLAEVTRR